MEAALACVGLARRVARAPLRGTFLGPGTELEAPGAVRPVSSQRIPPRRLVSISCSDMVVEGMALFDSSLTSRS